MSEPAQTQTPTAVNDSASLTAVLCAPAAARHYFISDLHLCAQEPHATQLFAKLLAQLQTQDAALYILGDLFEYWAGDDDRADTYNQHICQLLRRCSQQIPIYFLAGNRDFLIGADFAAATGVQLLSEPLELRLDGHTLLLLHGDSLCTDDTAYQHFRQEVRNPLWQRAFLARPLAERKAHIAGLRARSQQEKQDKPAAIMDVNATAVTAVLRQHHYPVLIHGHTHRLARHTLDIDGQTCTRWVLGDWHDSGNALLYQDGRFSFQYFTSATQHSHAG